MSRVDGSSSTDLAEFLLHLDFIISAQIDLGDGSRI